MSKPRKTLDQFIKEGGEKHNFIFDYSKVVYINNKSKVIIGCPIHGDFLQKPNGHLLGKGCNKCGRDSVGKKFVKTKECFIKEANKAHNNKYEYKKVEYINSQNKIIITCPIHGDFKQTPNHHINSGSGCSKCGKESHWRKSDYIKKAKDRKCIFYILRCFNESEEFYKIGITMKSVKYRYRDRSDMSYSYEIISETTGEAGKIWDLELSEKRKLKKFKYQPLIPFAGSKTECFSKYNFN